jgi:hypothetical protein
MKSLFDVNGKWNNIIGLLGTPVIVFVMLSWCSHKWGINNVNMSICFTIAVFIGSTNMYLAICEALIGVPFLLLTRIIFMFPIPFPFLSKPFTWFDEQSACAGVAALFAVWGAIILIYRLIINHKKNEKK